MKKYNTKKKVTITLLSLTAICLAGGLFYYVGTMKTEPPVNDTPSIVSEESDVNVREIDVPDKPTLDPQDDTKPTITDSDGTDTNPTDDNLDGNINPNSGGTTEPTQPTTQEKPSDDKPKTKDEATPPTDDTPPVTDDKGEEEQKIYEPNQSVDVPADGTISEDGTKIYIGGFGWIDWEGGGSEVTDAPNAGTGDLIGH